MLKEYCLTCKSWHAQGHGHSLTASEFDEVRHYQLQEECRKLEAEVERLQKLVRGYAALYPLL